MTRRWLLFAVLELVAVLMPALVPPAWAQLNLNPFSAYYQSVARLTAANDASGVQALIADGKSPNDTDDSGHAGLHIAAINGNARIVGILIKGGAQIDIKDPLGDTPLFYAADRNEPDICKTLLDARASPNAQNRSGVTPLMTAARRGNIEVVRVLLAHGADPTMTDFTGRDAAGWAEDSHKQALVQLLRQATAQHHR
ncbi:MAG TPA: ankyrin repeat domain-containing protein [Stellaceae bacterium]